ncbi:hypothetical protein LINGRAHAP2_LOCUS24830, partial [Linum grandiflorum]
YKFSITACILQAGLEGFTSFDFANMQIYPENRGQPKMQVRSKSVK